MGSPGGLPWASVSSVKRAAKPVAPSAIVPLWSSMLFCNELGFLAWLVPVGTLAGRAELGFAFAFGRPLVSASLAEPVVNSLFNLSHAPILSPIIYYVN